MLKRREITPPAEADSQPVEDNKYARLDSSGNKNVRADNVNVKEVVSTLKSHDVIRIGWRIGEEIRNSPTVSYLSNDKEKKDPAEIDALIKNLMPYQDSSQVLEDLMAIKNNGYVKDSYIHPDHMSACEFLGYYANRCFGNDKPLFKYADYLKAQISFRVFSIWDDYKKGTVGLLFFDNYETQSATDYQPRFIWWQPSYNVEDGSFILNNLEKITETINQKLGTHFNRHDFKKIYIRPFLDQSMVSSDNLDLSKVTFEYNLQIQVPSLNPDNWRELEPILNDNGQSPLGDDYVCILARGDIPASAQAIAKRYADYLRFEERYDFPVYKGSKPNEHEIYFIMKSDYSLCLGVFIFGKKNTDGLFEELEAFNKKHNISHKSAKVVMAYKAYLTELFKYKIENNIKKLKKTEEANASSWKNSSDETKYQRKASKYSQLKFFACCPVNLPADTSNLNLLKAAWIHPFYRRQGLLSKLWPTFQKRYGVFDIDSPSRAMRGFFRKQEINFITFNRSPIFRVS